MKILGRMWAVKLGGMLHVFKRRIDARSFAKRRKGSVIRVQISQI